MLKRTTLASSTRADGGQISTRRTAIAVVMPLSAA
jgi:hypothetical protein